jgi:glycosyltransferase involved in cell wall biosynthesis
MLVLHQGEPGALEFVERLHASDVPTEMLRMRADADPLVFARLLRQKPTIVHTHLVHADLHGLVAAAAARVPIRVSTKHGFNEFRDHRAIAIADRTASRFAHAQIAISHGLARYLEQTEGYGPGTFTVVHYGIDLGAPPPPPPTTPSLVAIGRLIPIKGFDVLLRAFAVAQRDIPELTLEIAGSGPLEDTLRRAAPPGVRLLGHVTPVAALLERNALVVVPSRGEGFGMVALEAAERGRAAIVSDVGGLPEIVANGETGLVVPPDDVDALANAIVSLARDSERLQQLGAAARQRAADQFSSEGAVDGVERVYRHLLQSRSTAAAASSTNRKSNGTR